MPGYRDFGYFGTDPEPATLAPVDREPIDAEMENAWLSVDLTPRTNPDRGSDADPIETWGVPIPCIASSPPVGTQAEDGGLVGGKAPYTIVVRDERVIDDLARVVAQTPLRLHLDDPTRASPSPPIVLSAETSPVPNPAFAVSSFRATRID